MFINLLLDSPIYNDILFHIMFLKSCWKIDSIVLGTCKALWLCMPFLKCKNQSPINKNIHGSLAEILEVKRLILAITITPVTGKDFHF